MEQKNPELIVELIVVVKIAVVVVVINLIEH